MHRKPSGRSIRFPRLLSTACLWAAFFCVAANAAQGWNVLFSVGWGENLHFKVNENKDTVSVGAVFSDSLHIYIYDLAGGRIVVFDSAGVRTREIGLESSGRATYAGDDFVVREDRAVFLNTVDRRLEVFAMNTGRHIDSRPYPADAFRDEPKRSARIINRIFLADGRLVLGNGYRVFTLEEGLSKAGGVGKQERPARGGSFVFLDATHRITKTGSFLYGAGRVRPVKSRYMPWGKQYTVFRGRLCAATLDKEGMKFVAAR
jgi:hypothetical protein